jgi:hypothetical protein
VLSSWHEFSSLPSPENLSKFGPYAECKNFQLINSSLQSQYSLISYSSILFRDSDETSVSYSGSDSLDEQDVMIFKNGICLPSSCSSLDAVNFVKNLLAETNFVVLNVNCQQNDESELQLMDFVLL